MCKSLGNRQNETKIIKIKNAGTNNINPYPKYYNQWIPSQLTPPFQHIFGKIREGSVTPPPLKFSYRKKKVYGKGQKQFSPSAK